MLQGFYNLTSHSKYKYQTLESSVFQHLDTLCHLKKKGIHLKCFSGTTYSTSLPSSSSVQTETPTYSSPYPISSSTYQPTTLITFSVTTSKTVSSITSSQSTPRSNSISSISSYFLTSILTETHIHSSTFHPTSSTFKSTFFKPSVVTTSPTVSSITSLSSLSSIQTETPSSPSSTYKPTSFTTFSPTLTPEKPTHSSISTVFTSTTSKPSTSDLESMLTLDILHLHNVYIQTPN